MSNKTFHRNTISLKREHRLPTMLTIRASTFSSTRHCMVKMNLFWALTRNTNSTQMLTETTATITLNKLIMQKISVPSLKMNNGLKLKKRSFCGSSKNNTQKRVKQNKNGTIQMRSLVTIQVVAASQMIPRTRNTT